MNYINNLGEFDSLADVWKEYPYGGKEGDYVVINGVNVAWNKYTSNWGEDTQMPDVNNEVNGDFIVKRDLRVGGEIINKDLKWIKEATVLNKGYFKTVDDLKRSYPAATAGSKAYVGSDYPYAIYLWDGKNAAWVDSGEYFDNSLRDKGYFATVEVLQAAYPIATSGSKAYVGVTYPFAIYLWDAATSTWVDSGKTGGDERVNLGDYYTKEETDAKVAELESDLNSSTTLLFLATLNLKQGAIATTGGNIESTTQLRPDDSIYIKGKYTLRLPEGFIFRRVNYYDVETNALLKSADKDTTTANTITIGSYDNGEKVVDCLTRFTIKKNDGSEITPSDLLSRCYSDILKDKINADKSELQANINNNYSEFVSLVDYYTEGLSLVTGKTMSTGSKVGDTASFVENTSAGWRYVKLSVKAGETYFIKGSVSGSTPKAYTITDTDGVITKIQTSGSFTGILNIDSDGFLVANGTSESKFKVALLDKIIVKKHTLNVLDSAGLFQGALNTSGGINESNLTQIYSGIIREKCDLILPNGFNIRRVVYYNNETGGFDSRTERDSPTATIGKEGCYARLCITNSDDTNIAPTDFPINNIGALLKEGNESNTETYIPLLNFDSDYTLAESFEAELEGMSASLAKNTVPSDYMERIYQKIDALIENNSDYITKYDAVELANEQGLDIAYPIYANGITGPITESVTLSGNTYDVTYDVTPAYKTYIYKLSHVKDGLYGNNVKKRTIFITACTHGWEKAGSFNTYLLMKRLCEDYINSDFYMKLRSLFDIWIIPCLNGYGIYHGTRTNARLVNINRNAPSPGWRVIGEPGNKDWSGEPNSEFETKLACHFIDVLKPDIYFDHHNFTPDSAMISFTSGISKLPCAPYFRALVDFTRCALKYFPQHFGTKFNIIQSADPNYYPNGSATDIGELHCYAYSKGTEFAFVLEVDYAIPFTDGVYTGFTDLKANTSDAYRLNEYILRSQLIHFCNAVLNLKK